MLKRILLLLLLCRSVSAADLFSISGGMTAISDQLGYAAQITSPYIANVIAIQIHAGQSYFQGTPYTLVQLGVMAPFHRTETFEVQFKTGIQKLFASDLTTNPGTGLHYTMGAEYKFIPKLSILGEAGYALSFANYANKLPGSPAFSGGFSLLIGPKFYL